MPIPICISLAVLTVASLAVVFIRSRRRAAKDPASDSARRRAVLEDCGDDVVWEIGKLRPIVATREFEARMGKRAFLRRVAFSVSAFLVAWLASRARSVAAFGTGTASRGERRTWPPKPMPVPEDIHTDSTVHNDDHTDGAGDGHSDSHSDTIGNHTDAGGNLESRSTGDRLSGKDRTMDIHTDQSDHSDSVDHSDSHTDTPNEPSSHSDGGGGLSTDGPAACHTGLPEEIFKHCYANPDLHFTSRF